MSRDETKHSLRHLTASRYGKFSKKQNEELQKLVAPHLESFDFAVDEGLSLVVGEISDQVFKDSKGRKIELSIEDASIGYPSSETSSTSSSAIYPSECRQKGTTYRGSLDVTLGLKVNGSVMGRITKSIGQIPVMVKSSRCNIQELRPSQLVKKKEEAEEMGGYFIIHGIEKVLRMLIVSRSNYPLAISRPMWRTKSALFTEYGILIRSVRKDTSAEIITIHYLSDGTCTLSFKSQKDTLYIPVIFILKAMISTTDQNIFAQLVKGQKSDLFTKNCALAMLRQAQNHGILSKESALKYLGERLEVKLENTEYLTKKEIGDLLLKKHICVHLQSNLDKFHFLIFTIRKLLSAVDGQTALDSNDSTMNHEVLLSGHLFLIALKDKLSSWLRSLRFELDKQITNKDPDLQSMTYLASLMKRGPDVGQQIEYVLATGNVVSRNHLALPQVSGFSVVAEKINFFRFLGQFRCVHRGAFFAQMRTTAVRKLLPESYGFLCPVHTPDGAPCGLLNHLSASCQITNISSKDEAVIPKMLTSLGVVPVAAESKSHDDDDDKYYLPVLFNGRLIGNVSERISQRIADCLRTMKVSNDVIPKELEIALIPSTERGLYPGLYLFSTPARMMRPVLNLKAGGARELIGTFEQVYLDVAVSREEIYENITSHMEISPREMLSVMGMLTPFSDFNQSPRNMYQCQMGKQTMAFPSHTIQYRCDKKMYQLQTPQAPIVRPEGYERFKIDEYPAGTNCIVAVISYTGYDMEDAMVLNKSSCERGFAYGTIHKSEIVDLRSKTGGRGHFIAYRFGLGGLKESDAGHLDIDGFPPIGALLKDGDPMYSYVDLVSGETHVEKYRGSEIAYVDQIKLLGDESKKGGSSELQRVLIKLRIPRPPIIGDKFSSRHGQKGVCSVKWPTENMPFSESGIVPDIIFNPHGFPSRMTIESMAGKSAALHGLCHDATPFTFSEGNPAIEHFGKCLVAAGYNFYGNERLYSGITGREFEADIFIGNIYYQRLRHMVSDKFQVRTTGPVDQLTHQPVQGRRRGGGVRFGEMERDALLAHGTGFLLQDRLLNCSDRCNTRLCTSCGSLLSPLVDAASRGSVEYFHPAATDAGKNSPWTCGVCKTNERIEIVPVPYVLRYLVAEMAAMNINVKLDVKK
ncbi:DNA-directed RNA polymerase I subunit RPA2-like isoform X2 [Oscarella lobularis]|uniref:DNA-directed RNA polymerase I subunit RPA2-like isoform X2 n=1 Tax=Oscarella lobularis TaxID=121494 RepID=UPI00331406E7